MFCCLFFKHPALAFIQHFFSLPSTLAASRCGLYICTHCHWVNITKRGGGKVSTTQPHCGHDTGIHSHGACRASWMSHYVCVNGCNFHSLCCIRNFCLEKSWCHGNVNGVGSGVVLDDMTHGRNRLVHWGWDGDNSWNKCCSMEN